MTSDLFIARGWTFDGNADCGKGPWDPRPEPATLDHQPVALPLIECGEVTEHCGCCSTGWAIDSANECWVSIGSGSTMYRVTRERMESAKKIAGDW